jgi:hypothetical protein
MNQTQEILISVPLFVLNQLLQMLQQNKGIDGFVHHQIQSVIDGGIKLINDARQKLMFQNQPQSPQVPPSTPVPSEPIVTEDKKLNTNK